MTTTLREAAAMLRGTAVKLEQLQSQASLLVPQNCDLSEAITQLRVELPAECEKFIHLEVKSFSHRPDDAPDVNWTIWDGTTHFCSKTLAGAVNSCLASHAPAPENPVGVAQEALTPMPF